VAGEQGLDLLERQAREQREPVAHHAVLDAQCPCRTCRAPSP
jgi:hypothetical protein